jgi:dienelactone hydrolase
MDVTVHKPRTTRTTRNLSIELAIAEPALDAAVVFYGGAPGTWKPPAPGTFIPSDALARITAPVLGLYAEDDRPISPTLAPTASKFKELGKSYESHTFGAASHAFMREQSGGDGANLKAAQQAWPLMIAWLRKHTT